MHGLQAVFQVELAVIFPHKILVVISIISSEGSMGISLWTPSLT